MQQIETGNQLKPKVSLRGFMAQIAVCAVLFAMFNVLVARVTRNPARLLIDRIHSTPPVTDLIIGNSLIAVSFDNQVFEKVHPDRKVLNLALGATGTPEQYLLAREYFSRASAVGHSTKVAYYCIMDRMLTESTTVPFNEVSANRAVIYFSRVQDVDKAVEFYFGGSTFHALLLKAARVFPVIPNRHQLWGQVEHLRRRAEEIGLKHKATNEFGRIEDSKLLVASNIKEFARNCARDAQEPMHFSAPIEELLRMTKENNVKLVVVRMPATSEHRRVYYGTPEWRLYENAVKKRLQSEGLPYIDATKWVPDMCFPDGLHMNKKGGTQFTTKLLEQQL